MSLDSELDSFKELFKRQVAEQSSSALRWVSVESIDWGAKTMVCTDSEGLKYENILLGLGAKMVKPAPGSDCLIAIIEGDVTSGVLLYAESAELDERNGGTLGGLIIIAQLVEKINQLVGEINAINAVFNTHIHTTTATISATANVGVISPPTSNGADVTEFNKDDFEDTTITH